MLRKTLCFIGFGARGGASNRFDPILILIVDIKNIRPTPKQSTHPLKVVKNDSAREAASIPQNSSTHFIFRSHILFSKNTVDFHFFASEPRPQGDNKSDEITVD